MNFENYRLRLINNADAVLYFDFIEANRERVIHYFPNTNSKTTTLEETKLLLQERDNLHLSKEFYNYALFDLDANKIVASIFLKSIDWKIGKCEMGYFIDARYEGKGLVSKVVKLLIKTAFEDLELNKVYLRIEPSNESSKRVAERNGFTLEGKLRSDFMTSDGKRIDCLYYGLIKSDVL